eukprot:XP_013983003.1 PREDICTED: AN1-type zinc finger protein 6 isoform X1 [Salmo salar]
MAQETNQNQGPLLCTTGCGFYSNPRNNGMCSMCYKDFLQRQNNNGRVSPPVSSSAAVSNLGESLLAQCSESSTVDVPSATTHTAIRMNRYSRVVSSQSFLTAAPATHSEEESTATSEDLKTEEIQERAPCRAAVESEQQEPSTAGSSGTRPNRQDSQPMRSQDRKSVRRPAPEDSSRKRKLEESDGEKVSVSVSEDMDQASVDGLDKPSDSDEPKAARKNRCFSCRKKVGLTGFDCRCGNVFCSMHRYSDVHNCTFNYKADAAEKIRKANPVCVGEKIQKI